MMKRFVVILTVLAMIAALFCACTPKKADEQKPEDVTTPDINDEGEVNADDKSGESTGNATEPDFTLPGSEDDPYELPIIPITPAQPSNTTTATTQPTQSGESGSSGSSASDGSGSTDGGNTAATSEDGTPIATEEDELPIIPLG